MAREIKIISFVYKCLFFHQAMECNQSVMEKGGFSFENDSPVRLVNLQ